MTLSRPLSRWLAVSTCISLWACDAAKDSGQTGSPFAEPPDYQSPGEFGPESPGGGNGNPGNGEGLDNNPIWRLNPSDLAKQQGDLLLVLNSSRGLLIYDTQDASNPTQIGQLEFEAGSYPYQLLVEENAATLVMLEQVGFSSTEIPVEEVGTQVQRLIRVDLSDPSQPTRVAELDFGGNFWNLQQRGNHFFALTQRFTSAPAQCNASGVPVFLLDQGPASQTLQVTDYSLSGNTFSEVATVDLPSDGLGYITEHGFLGVSNGYEPEHTVGWVSFGETGNEALRPVSTLNLPGQLQAVTSREGQLALVLTSGAFQLYDSTTETLSQLGTAELGLTGSTLEFITGSDKLTVSGESGSAVIDVATPSAPLVQALPGNIQQLAATPFGILGVAPPSSGTDLGTFSLWDISSTPTQLGSVSTDWNYLWISDYGFHPWSLAGSTFVLPFHRQGDQYPSLGALELSATGLTVQGETRVREMTSAPLLKAGSATAQMAYGIGATQIEIVQLATAAPAPAQPTTAVIDFLEPVVLSRAETERYTIEIRVRPDTVSEVVFSPRAGGDPTVIELGHRADDLIVAGETVVAAGLRWNSECQYLDPATDGALVTDEPPACSPLTARGLTVFSTGVSPAVLSTMPIDAQMDWVNSTPDVTLDTTWEGYLPLSDSHLVFVVERMIHCNSQASCDELGVPAYTSFGSPGGMSCAMPNPDDCPPPANAIIEFVTGNKREQLYYVLDLAAATPQLEAPVLSHGFVEIRGEGPLNLSAHAFFNGDEFALRGSEYLYNDQGNSLTDANGDGLMRFWLNRFRYDEAGTIEPLPAVNVPGRVVGYYGDSVYTVEPKRVDSTTRATVLHRSTIENDGAFTQESTELGSGYPDSLQMGDHAYVIQGPPDYCAEALESELYVLDMSAEELNAERVMTLPWGNWSFDTEQPTSNDRIQMRGGPLQYLGRVQMDISNPQQPAVVSYDSVNPHSAP